MALWDKLDTETAKAYHAFCIYRDMLPWDRTISRAIRKVRELGGKSTVRHGEVWSSQNNWIKRAAAYDEHVDQKARKQLEAQKIRAKVRHAKIGQRLQSRSSRLLAQITNADLDSTDVLKQLQSIVRGIEEGISIERTALGIDNVLDRHDDTQTSTEDAVDDAIQALERSIQNGDEEGEG